MAAARKKILNTMPVQDAVKKGVVISMPQKRKSKIASRKRRKLHVEVAQRDGDIFQGSKSRSSCPLFVLSTVSTTKVLLNHQQTTCRPGAERDSGRKYINRTTRTLRLRLHTTSQRIKKKR